MPKMDGTGPVGKGSGTGRGMGRCRKNLSNEDVARPGGGSGKRRQSGGGRGQGKRLQSGLQK
jgi:hypothetical protein